MKFVEPSVEIILENDPYIKVELAGRTCYKSKAKEDETPHDFFNKLVKSNHTAMVEHAAFVFRINPDKADIFVKFQMGRYLNTTIVDNRYIVSGNIRALNEYEPAQILLRAIFDYYGDEYRDICYSLTDEALDAIGDNGEIVQVIKPDEMDQWLLTDLEKLSHTYTTFKFTEDRGVTHEHVRQRPASFGQESTRYCNYGKDGFGSELTYMEPTTFDSWADKFKGMFWGLMSHIEYVYLAMVDETDPDRLQPQQARAVLPQCVKADIVITADGLEWNHIFNLRYKGTTGKPHPDMKAIMTQAYPLYCEHVFDLANMKL